MATPPRISTRTKLAVDVTLLLSLMVVSAPQATGIGLHEWLSVLFVPVFVVHLVLNWDWIARVYRRFLKPLGATTRINAVWDLLIYGVMVLVFFSGVLASRAALPAFLTAFVPDAFWNDLHHVTSNLLLPLLGIHLGLHAKWIVRAIRARKESA